VTGRSLLRVPDVAGAGWIRLDWYATGLFVATAAAAVVGPDMLRAVSLVVALGLFGSGCGLFLWAFALGVERSRTEEVSVAELFLLSGDVAPRGVKTHLMAAMAVQVVVAFAAAGARPFTSLAFGILVPMFGLGIIGRWAAQYGRFTNRTVLRTKRKPMGEGPTRG